MHRVVASIAACLALLVAACGGGDKNTDTPPDPIRNVPNEAGIRDKVKAASTADETEFPASKGKTLQQLADGMAAGPSLAMASSIFTAGDPSRMAFGMVGPDGLPVYGPTAIYVAPTPDDPAVGPFVAVYGADVKFPKKGQYTVLATTKLPNGKLTGATSQVQVSTEKADPIPR